MTPPAAPSVPVGVPVVAGIASERRQLQSLVVQQAGASDRRADFARALHEIEYRCLRAMEAWLEPRSVDAYLHDGMMVWSPDAPLGAETLRSLETQVLQQVGIRIRLTESRHGTPTERKKKQEATAEMPT